MSFPTEPSSGPAAEPGPATDLPRLWSAADIDAGLPGDDRLQVILDWSRDFLVARHPELGRTGPVCPYTSPSLRRNLFYLAAPTGATEVDQLAALLDTFRLRYQEMAAELSEEDGELLTFVIVLPDFDHADSTQLDALQHRIKDDFVRDGLMIGQFHPHCEEPGLWNKQFRPLRAPIPLLAMRRMLAFDLPFLIESGSHLDAYLERFAPLIPSRIRAQLTARISAP